MPFLVYRKTQFRLLKPAFLSQVIYFTLLLIVWKWISTVLILTVYRSVRVTAVSAYTYTTNLSAGPLLMLEVLLKHKAKWSTGNSHTLKLSVGFREIAKIKQIDPNRYKLQNNEFLLFGLGWLNSSTDAYFCYRSTKSNCGNSLFSNTLLLY